MNASIRPQATGSDVHALMQRLGRDAVSAAEVLALADTTLKNEALSRAAAALRARAATILEANAEDMRAARDGGLSGALLDRLRLDEKRVEAMARGLDEVVTLADPIGSVLAEWQRPNG